MAETPTLALKWDSYWVDYTQNKTTYLDTINNQESDYRGQLTVDNAALFTVGSLTGGSVSRRRMLQAADYTTDDRDMIRTDTGIDGGDVPVAIKICITGTDEATWTLKGMQVSYGQFSNRANAIAGPAHGDLTAGCTDFAITRRVQEIALYKVSDEAVYRGVKITLDPTGASSADVPIALGLVPSAGMTQETITYADTDQFQWFGFKADVDGPTGALKGSAISPVAYDPVEFNKLRSFVVAYPALLAQTNRDIQAGRDGQREWTNLGIYEQVIHSTITTKIAKVVPTDVFVVRPENVQQVQRDIDAQVAQVNEEKRIAERQRANEETNEREQASSNAAATASSNQRWVDNIVQRAAETIRDLKIEHDTIFTTTVNTMEANHATELFTTRQYYRSQIMRLVGLREDDPCDDNCLELVGLKVIALAEATHANEDD